MLVKITQKAGYGDRFGVLHEFGAVADLPEAIAHKLQLHGMGTLVKAHGIVGTVVKAPVAEAEPEAVVEPEAAPVAEVEVKRSPGRPPKAR
jgi:hypothetical protein